MLKLPENHVFRSKKPIEGQKKIIFQIWKKSPFFSAQKCVFLKLIVAIETRRKCFIKSSLTNIEILDML